jgi:hypothetical protein
MKGGVTEADERATMWILGDFEMHKKLVAGRLLLFIICSVDRLLGQPGYPPAMLLENVVMIGLFEDSQAVLSRWRSASKVVTTSTLERIMAAFTR